ncbi:hypothetical protein DXG03_007371 [Asterophora parasitica]|uniref:Uncharacterized protein n=1 Tax=Asterophora parasitica TaxID=117018 RepID=A0A9P7FZ58_9AGAR|nr:hypothetical protein DXG03_007371 [Asterophora parasitica]
MSYVNPLHAPVSSAQYSPFSFLGDAVAVQPSATQSSGSSFTSPFRRRLPQPPYMPNSKWRGATGHTNQVHSAIAFDYTRYAKQGVPMRELSTRSATALAQMIGGAGDAVLVDGCTREGPNPDST